MKQALSAADDLLAFARGDKFSTILADPPWQFSNRTGKIAPEHRRLHRYGTLSNAEIFSLPVGEIAAARAHLYLWVPNALVAEGLEAMRSWGFTYKTNIIWYKVRKDGGPDRRGVGFYFRNVTEMMLFGVRGKNARTLSAGRGMPNVIVSRKGAHSVKPEEQFEIIESCSWGPYLELFARRDRAGWQQWGNQAPWYESACAGNRPNRVRMTTTFRECVAEVSPLGAHPGNAMRSHPAKGVH